MGILSLFLILFGIIPVSLMIISKWSGILLFLGIRIPQKDAVKFQSWDKWYSNTKGEPVPWKSIGGSRIRLTSGEKTLLAEGKVLTGTKEPRFSTLGCDAYQVGKAKWQLEIEFEIRNLLDREIVIDDIHACHFETNAFAPPLLTISFYGDVWLRQDNTILKEKRDYSLLPGDGYRINLLFEATRIEAAPAYGVLPAETEGSVTVVFGLLLDYYSMTASSELDRRAIPSDCIYVFQYSANEMAPWFKGIDADELEDLKRRHSDSKEKQEFIQRLEGYLSEHLNFRPVPTK